MNKYNIVLKYIILVLSSIAFLFLLTGLIFYLADVKLNNELKAFFSFESVPMMVIGLVFFGLIIALEVKTLFFKNKAN